MADTLPIVLALVVGGVALLWAFHLSAAWRATSKSGARLPKGSFGWPLIGESLTFAKNPAAFGFNHIKKYGTLFKTNLFLQPNIVGTTPDFAKFISTKCDIFLSDISPPNLKLIGSRAFIFRDGPHHIAVKKLLLKALRPDAIKSKVTPLEKIILKHLESWVQKGSVVGRDVTKALTLETAFWLLVRADDLGSTAEGRKALSDFEILDNAFLSIPVNLPGTTYRGGLKARKDVVAYLGGILEKRKREENLQNDILGALLSAHDDTEVKEELKDFDDECIVDNLLLISFAAYDTTATSLLWILKYLKDYPEVFRRIQAEHQAILKSKGPTGEGPRLTWDDIRKMEYTARFSQEVQRHLTVLPLMLRKASQDVEYEGNLIPKGWSVSLMTKALHSSPAVFPEPEVFNPDRFETAPKPYHYMPFGSGVHMCPGPEIVRVVVLIFVHHLVTTYSYEAAAPDTGIEYKTLATPIGGYPIKIRRATKSN